jgi:hypothetical protein
MRVDALWAMAVGLGTVLLVGFLDFVQDLLSGSIFGAPSLPEIDARRDRADEENSSSSATPIG